MTLEVFCTSLASSRLSLPEKATAILWYRDSESRGVEQTAGELAATIREYALGNPHTTQLEQKLRRSTFLMRGKRGFKVRAEARATIPRWLSGAIEGTTEAGESPDDLTPIVAPVASIVSTAPQARPTIIIGSSSEALSVARALHAELEHVAEPTVWNAGVFSLSRTTIESLQDAAQAFDFAALIVTPDDTVSKRGRTAMCPRDNVLFELGLFMGALGRDRTFVVQPNQDLDLPTDLLGLTTARYTRRSDGNVRAALTRAALDIADRITALGRRSRAGSTLARV